MGKSGITLYRHTHPIAIGILAVLIITATAAFGVIRHEASATCRDDAPTLGRFVVTPGATRFEEPTKVLHRCNRP